MTKKPAIHRRVFLVSSGSWKNQGKRNQFWGETASLSDEGRQQARQFAYRQEHSLSGCEIFVCSPLLCAKQTMQEIMAYLSATEVGKINESPYFWTTCPRGYQTNDPKTTLQGLVHRRPAFAYAEGSIFFHKRNGETILPKMTALGRAVAVCVTHKGPIDFVLAHTKHISQKSEFGDKESFFKIEPIGDCEGMELTFDENGEPVGIRILRLPAPIPSDAQL